MGQIGTKAENDADIGGQLFYYAPSHLGINSERAMNEVERILAINEIVSTMLSEEAIFYTQISAYLVVAYLVGSKLTTFQITLINFLFIVATLLGMFGVVSFHMQILEIRELWAVVEKSRHVYNAMYVALLFRSALLIGGLVFMWQVRHPKTE